MLTDEEINRIFSWLPYRDDWPVDRNKNEDNIGAYYGDLIRELSNNEFFSTYYSDDGGLSNYLGFVCYPFANEVHGDNAVSVYVSLCAPIAAYGQTAFHKTAGLYGYSYGYGFIGAEKVGDITDSKLFDIEIVIKAILKKYRIDLVDKELACRLLPNEIAESLKHENHNVGNQYLHGLFHVTD
jgi:hypothetical protein